MLSLHKMEAVKSDGHYVIVGPVKKQYKMPELSVYIPSMWPEKYSQLPETRP